MTELFEEKDMESKSPRLKWIEKHKFNTHESPLEDKDWDPWIAWIGDPDYIKVLEEFGDSVFGYGKIEEEAIVEAAKIYRIPLWNEEGIS